MTVMLGIGRAGSGPQKTSSRHVQHSSVHSHIRQMCRRVAEITRPIRRKQTTSTHVGRPTVVDDTMTATTVMPRLPR